MIIKKDYYYHHHHEHQILCTTCVLKAEQGLPGICSLQSAPPGTFWHIYTEPLAVSPTQHKHTSIQIPLHVRVSWWDFFSLNASHLIFNLVGIGRGSVRIFVGVQRSNKLVVVNVAVCVSIKDIRHCCHFQFTSGELCRKITGVPEFKLNMQCQYCC